VAVRVDGAAVGSLVYSGAERAGVTLDLSGALSPGEHTIELVSDGPRAIPYTLEAAWRRSTPADAPGAPLTIETALAAEEVALGGTVRLVVTVENTSTAGVASPLARVGLPAGVRVEPKQLEDLRDRGRVAFFETRPREVTLYWEGMAAGDRHELALELVAEVPGTFTAPPSVVYPYYTTDGKRWADGPTLRVLP
jgi:alpha-2-macroglobulin-like protein